MSLFLALVQGLEDAPGMLYPQELVDKDISWLDRYQLKNTVNKVWTQNYVKLHGYCKGLRGEKLEVIIGYTIQMINRVPSFQLRIIFSKISTTITPYRFFFIFCYWFLSLGRLFLFLFPFQPFKTK